MSIKRSTLGYHLLLPGEFLARRFDEGYAKFVNRIKREMRKGNRRLTLYTLLVPAECVLAFVVGVSASYFEFNNIDQMEVKQTLGPMQDCPSGIRTSATR